MKVIDLLNKIVNGENLPNKVKLECVNSINEHNCFYEFNPIAETYVNGDNQLIQNATCFATLLNLEVEIIEEDKKINEKIDEDFFEAISSSYRERIMKDKIDEIIDYLEEKEC